MNLFFSKKFKWYISLYVCILTQEFQGWFSIFDSQRVFTATSVLFVLEGALATVSARAGTLVPSIEMAYQGVTSDGRSAWRHGVRHTRYVMTCHEEFRLHIGYETPDEEATLLLNAEVDRYGMVESSGLWMIHSQSWILKITEMESPIWGLGGPQFCCGTFGVICFNRKWFLHDLS